jgi:hypothetical protein
MINLRRDHDIMINLRRDNDKSKKRS